MSAIFFHPSGNENFAACDGGLYGENCSIHCGMCLNSSQCQPINGSCMEGCDSGFLGENCTQGECDLDKIKSVVKVN